MEIREDSSKALGVSQSLTCGRRKGHVYRQSYDNYNRMSVLSRKGTSFLRLGVAVERAGVHDLLCQATPRILPHW